MEENKKNKPNLLLIIIAVLLCILVIQAGVLISKLSSPKSVETSKNTSPIQETQTTNLTHQLQQPPISVAYDPYFQTHAKQRRPARSTSSHDSYAQMDDPLAALERIQSRMNSLFDHAMMENFPSMQNLMSNTPNGVSAFDLEPPVDIQDDGKNYIVKSDMPGLEKDKINIKVTGDMLSITGMRENVSETTDEATGFVSQERSYGSFSKSLRLPGPVDETKVFAHYKNGVLTIGLPKAESKKTTQKISVQ